jgi:hypothetical protein
MSSDDDWMTDKEWDEFVELGREQVMRDLPPKLTDEERRIIEEIDQRAQQGFLDEVKRRTES